MGDLTAVSLFAGIGGFDKALQAAGIRTVAAVEIDPDCRGVLRRQFPGTAIFSDVREVTGEQLRAAGFVPSRGIITGGFPCQDLSVAGRRAGLGGARSGLFWEIMRLADELSPRWLLLENVPGLLSAVCPCPGEGACVVNGRAVRCGEWRAERVHGPADELVGDTCPVCAHDWDFHDAGGFCSPCQDTCEGLPEVKLRKVFVPDVPHGIKGGACPGGCMAGHGGAMGTVLGALGKRGYGFAGRVLDAQFFGVPQRRRRVFIAGCLGDRAAPVEVLLEPESIDRDSAAGAQTRTRVAGTLAASAGGGGLGGCGQSANAITGRLVESPAPFPGSQGAVAHALTAREGKGPDSDATSGLILAPTLESGDNKTGGTRPPGTTVDTAESLIVATLQGGGKRGHRIDAEGAAGGHLVAMPVQDGRDFEKAQNGLGIGRDGDPSFTLDTTGAQSVMVADTLRSHPRPGSNTTGAVVPVALRGRDGGSQAECGEPGDPAFTVRTPGGGSSYPMIAHALTSEGADASEDGTGRGTPLVTVPIAATLTSGTAAGDGVREPGRRREDDVNLVAAPMAFSPQNSLSGGGSIGYNEIPASLQANKVMAVHAPAVGIAENQRGELVESAISHQLTAGGGKPGQGYGAVLPDCAVRRLTPMECERLQGFPDEWTRWRDDGTEQSDSARYRQCGNAVAVPVVQWIAERVAAVEAAAEAGEVA